MPPAASPATYNPGITFPLLSTHSASTVHSKPHAVVDHRGDDGNVKRLAGNLSSWKILVTVMLHENDITPFGSNKTYRSFLVEYKKVR